MNEQNKKVPTLRFKGFTNDWEQRKLGDFGKVAMNKRIFKNQTSDEGDVPFYKIGTFGGVADSYITKELFEEYKLKYPYPRKGDLLISASGSIGRVIEYNGKDEYFQDSNIVWLDHDNRLDNSFLKQFYNIIKWQGLEGSTIKRLYNKNILATKIDVPSISEQLRIGDFLQQFDTLITLQQRKLDLLKQLKKSLLQKMFADKGSTRPILRFNGFTDDWEYRKLKNFSKIFIGLVTTMTKHYSSKGTFLIRNSNISENHISHQDPIFLDKDFAEENKNRKFRINDVVTVHTGDIGTSAVISEAEEGAIGFATIATRLNTNYLYPLFVSDYLNTDAHKAWARRMSTGDGRNNYNLADFKRIIIPSPQEIKEQEIIANIIAKIEIEIFCCQKGLRSLKQLKQGLLQQMFI